MQKVRIDTRYYLIIGALLLTALYLEIRPSSSVMVARRSLDGFPLQIGAWGGSDIPLEREVVEQLKLSDHLNRVYLAPGMPPVYLYVGYHNTQEQGEVIHSPKNCLPGSGWYPIQTGRETIQIPEVGTGAVNCFLIQKGNEKQVVLYWYQARGRVIASEYTSKLWMIYDAATINRTDGALIRIVVPDKLPDDQAKRIALSFVSALFPLLDSYIPG